MAKILHLTHRYWPVQGGSEQYVKQIATRQVRAGNEVTVVATNAEDLAYFWDPGAGCLAAGETTDEGVRLIRVAVKHTPGAPHSFGVLRYMEAGLSRVPGISGRAGFIARWAPYLPDLAPTLSALGDDWQLVYGWNVTFDSLMNAARHMAVQSKCPFIAVPFVHLGEGPRSPIRRYYTMPHQLRLLGDAERVIVQTGLEASYLAQNGIAPGRMAIVGAGIDPEELNGGDGEAFRQRHNWPGKIIASIGALTLNKGTFHLLEAARRLWMTGYEFKLYLAGPMMDDFRTYWTQLPAVDWDRVLYLGTISDAEKRDLLAATDILAMPSRVESFGIVFLEAWFYGKPVIGADAGAIRDVVEDGTDGRLVPFGDADALARAMAEIFDDRELARLWGENGRRKAMEHYTWDAVYSRFMATQAKRSHSKAGDKVMI